MIRMCAHSCMSIIFLMISLSSANGLTMVPYTLSELWEAANLVGRGEVVRHSSQWVGQRIYTTVHLRLSGSLLKNTQGKSLPKYIEFKVLGGSVKGISQVIPGSPQLKHGEEVFFFLRCQERPWCEPVGLGQGLWRPKESKGTIWRSMTDQVSWQGQSTFESELTLEQLMTRPSTVGKKIETSITQ